MIDIREPIDTSEWCPSTHGAAGYAPGSRMDGADVICGLCGERIESPSWIADFVIGYERPTPPSEIPFIVPFLLFTFFAMMGLYGVYLIFTSFIAG